MEGHLLKFCVLELISPGVSWAWLFLGFLGLPLDELAVAFLFLPTERVPVAAFVRASATSSSSELELLFILKCASNVVSASGESEWPSPSLSLPWEDLPIWWSMACLKSHSTNGSELSSFSSEAVPLSPSAVFQPLVRLRKGRPMFQRRGPYKWRNWCRISPRLRLVIADCRWCSCI